MIDYDATLKKFFDQILVFLDKRSKNAKDKEEQERILHTMQIVRTVASDPQKYADYNTRVKNNLVAHAEAFMPNQHDNSVFLLYSQVLFHIGNLHSQFDYYRKQAQEKLLQSLKTIEYKNSTNMLKDLYYPFLSTTRFAVKDNQK